MKLSWKQLLIAAGLFLAGYFSFNGSAAQALENPRSPSPWAARTCSTTCR
jgi:hypothetical protein